MSVGRAPSSPLAGWRVLVPRSGPWGERARALLEDRGAVAVAAELLSIGPPPHPGEFEAALGRLADGRYDWLMVTSAASAEQLRRRGARVPATTRVAAVGEATAEALRAAGVPVAYTSGLDSSGAGISRAESSGAGLAEGWQARHGGAGHVRILIPRSSLSPATLPASLAAWGHDVDTVTAYVVATAMPEPSVVADARSGELDAILVTSGSIARAIAEHLAPLHARVCVVSIGPVTTAEAEARGISIARTAARPSLEALVDALGEVAATCTRGVSARGAR